jgi:pilus assembly protein CpaF
VSATPPWEAVDDLPFLGGISESPDIDRSKSSGPAEPTGTTTSAPPPNVVDRPPPADPATFTATTPPTPPTAPPEPAPFTAPAASSDDLDDLFAEPLPPTQNKHEPAPPPFVVADLTTSVEVHTDDPSPPAPTSPPAPRPSPSPPPARPTVEPSVAAVAESVAAPTVMPMAETVSILPPSPAPSMGDRIGGMRRAAEAASFASDKDAKVVADRAAFEHRLNEIEHYFGYVDRLLGLVNQDPELQSWANNVVLTRDPVLDSRQRRELEERMTPKMLDARIVVDSQREAATVFDIAYDELTGISVLGDLWREDSVDEICIDAWDKIAVERRGRLERTGYRFRSPDHARAIARTLSQKISDRGVSNVNSLVTAQLPQARVQFVYGALSAAGLAIAIRKFRPLMGMEMLLDVGALTPEMADFLGACVRARATIIVSGGTGTGKTTAINALSEFIPDDERVITIEDAFELQLSNTHVVSLQAKQRATTDDLVVVSQADLLVASLRMRPDRIVVGEIREPAAASVFFDAASTGHDGSMTTIHAESTTSALNNRLAALLMRSQGGFSEHVARSSVAQAVQVVVQITRRRSKRFISEIAIVDENSVVGQAIRPEPLFTGDVDQAATVTHRRTGALRPDTQLALKLADAGEDVSRWTID